jgi:hypothetical protein
MGSIFGGGGALADEAASAAMGSGSVLSDPFAGNTMAALPDTTGQLIMPDAPLGGGTSYQTGGAYSDPFGGSTMDAGGGGFWGDVGTGLGKLGSAVKDLKQPTDANKSQAQKVQIDQAKAPLGQAGQGARNLAALVQLLQQRDMGFFPSGGSSGKPIMPQQTTGGLLGF